MSIVKYKYFSLLEIHCKHTLYITDGKTPNESFLCYKSVCYSNPKICPRETCHYLPTIFQPCIFSCVVVVFFPPPLSFFIETREKKNILATKCTVMRRWSIPDARKGGTRHSGRETSGDGIGECNGATAARRRWRGSRRKWNSISEPGKYVWGCLLCYIFARRTGWPFKTPRCHSVVQPAPLSLPWKQGRCLIFEKSASFYAVPLLPTDNKRGEIKR